MAGGALGNQVPCMICMSDELLTKATRIYEGIEDDHYTCDKGHSFGLDFRRGPATEPQWPPAQALVEAFKKR